MLWSFQCEDARRAENVREHFLNFLHTFAARHSDFAAAELIFGELIANVVRYAPGRVAIRVEWLEQSPVLRVRDHGKGFDPKFALPDDPLAESGRGLFLVQALGKHVDVESEQGRGTTVSVVLPVFKCA
ncbi:MAG: hypothetical protein NVSMB31_07680 [Vulcanimicrobiaceae bacterium]